MEGERMRDFGTVRIGFCLGNRGLVSDMEA